MTRGSAEVIVVGAGPAGAAAGLLLARAGRDVLILDRAAFPRAKPCGDCLSAGATALLHRLGVLDRVLAAPHARLRGWRIVAPDGSAFEAALGQGPPAPRSGHAQPGPPDCALTVERAVLDAVLLDAALAAGCRVEQCTVTDVERGRSGAVTGVRARSGVRSAGVVIGADGLRSIVANRLGARTAPGSLRKLSLTFHLHARGAGDLGEMHVGDGVCAGIAPVRDGGRCNVTLVADAARFGRMVAGDATGFACDALDALPRLRGRVAHASLLDAVPLASGPFDRPVRRVAFHGAVLVGDAAGYFDPFTGQGVYQALASAELLAPFVDDALRRRDVRASAFSGYVDARATLLRGARLVQHGIDAVLCRPALANHAISRIRRAPAFARAVIDVTGDVAPVRTLLSARALSSLLLPTSLPENAA